MAEKEQTQQKNCYSLCTDTHNWHILLILTCHKQVWKLTHFLYNETILVSPERLICYSEKQNLRSLYKANINVDCDRYYVESIDFLVLNQYQWYFQFLQNKLKIRLQSAKSVSKRANLKNFHFFYILYKAICWNKSRYLSKSMA